MGGRKLRPAQKLAGIKSRGELVAASLKDLGWTQATFAEHLDVREATVSEWVHNRPEPPKVVVLYLKLLVRFRGVQEHHHG